MNIAILADVHGRILLAFKVVERYQRETGEHIDLILQCGDVGIFPDTTRLDNATKRHAELDGTELGFAEYFVEPRDEVEAVLSKLRCNMICVRGNHEDHSHLDALENETDEPIYPVDCYQRVWVMKTGEIFTAEFGPQQLRVLGVGRVGPPTGETDPTLPKYIQARERVRLSRLDTRSFDVLLTHDARRDFIRPGIGMEEIGTILDNYRPVYHFFGHTGKPVREMVDQNGTTIASKLSDFEWEETDRGQCLKDGCLGILRWKSREEQEYEVVAAQWLREYTPHTWTYL